MVPLWRILSCLRVFQPFLHQKPIYKLRMTIVFIRTCYLSVLFVKLAVCWYFFLKLVSYLFFSSWNLYIDLLLLKLILLMEVFACQFLFFELLMCRFFSWNLLQVNFSLHEACTFFFLLLKLILFTKLVANRFLFMKLVAGSFLFVKLIACWFIFVKCVPFWFFSPWNWLC